MDVLLSSLTPNLASTMSLLGSSGAYSASVKLVCEFMGGKVRVTLNGEQRISLRCAKASAERRSEAIEEVERTRGFSGSAMELTTLDRGFGDARDFPVWEKIGAVVRLTYGIGIYGAMGLARRFICTGGFDQSLDAIVEGLCYAVPPIMALLFILDDEVVKLWPHARVIRDVEDEELRSFFYGMSPRQGALADIFQRGTNLLTDSHGMASLTGMLPPFVPFAQAFAAVLTAALTVSFYYVAASPKDGFACHTFFVNSLLPISYMGKQFAAWYERRQMKKIYSPLLEGILFLYLGFEWIRTDNTLAPIITHGIYSTVILGHGLRKIYDNRRRLRQRIQQLNSEGMNSNKL